MSSVLSHAPAPQIAKHPQGSTAHRVRVWIAGLASVSLLIAIGAYGANYYTLPLDQRPYSDKHALLKPSGVIGLKLGILGTILFFIIFLYGLRRIIPFLRRWGTARQWMDFHVIAGVTAPVVIAYHASFKFQGIAGVAFWIMLAVALSGVIGRYLYAQIPRSIGSASVSARDLNTEEHALSAALLGQSCFSEELLEKVFHFPTQHAIRGRGLLSALGEMLMIDLSRPFKVAYLRRAAVRRDGRRAHLWGFRSSGISEVEAAVRLAREKASLTKRILFLDKAQQVFHLWHVIHRPFSYAFAVLAILHIAVVLGFGFAAIGLR